MIIDEDDYHAALSRAIVQEGYVGEEAILEHYGTKRHSGRYPWGSGDEPYQSAGDFQSAIKELRKQKVPEAEIAAGFGMNSSELRGAISQAKEEHKQFQISMAEKLHEKGLSNVAIAERMGIPDTTVGNLLKPGAKVKASILTATSNMLRAQVADKKYVDVGKGVELYMGVSHEKLRDSVRLLEKEGYVTHYLTVPQLGNDKKTTLKVLTAPETTFSEVLKNRDLIQPASLKSLDGGRSYDRVLPPVSIKSSRVKVRYAEEGGNKADGVIYVRPGVKDVSLGKANYAQVRVAVDGTHYLKGMAMYGQEKDFPPGVDLVFNTNKSNTGNKLDAMKPMKTDPDGTVSKDDPFGSNIRDQVYKLNPDGTEARTSSGDRIVESVMNKVNEEGKWDQWSRNLSSQMLSKQKPALAKTQLDMTYESKRREYDEILSMTNPTVQKHLLGTFSEAADSSAVNLKAAALPRQATKVILPIDSMNPREVYAPTFNHGEKVVLVRFPHGGKFEIPEVTVNNRHPEARKLLGNAPDAIGIHHSVAERLSGADFDGDTVLVIPNKNGKIETQPALKGLKDFDTRSAYPPYDGMRTMSGGVWNAQTKRVDFEPGRLPSTKLKGTEMGKVSNLITDMTIKGAPNDEIVRAVRHSMVVIDAEKHSLNYKQSAIDNGIAALKKKYQSKENGSTGASTLISLASSETKILDRKPRPASEGGPIDRLTGKKVYVETGTEFHSGKLKTIDVERLANTDNAHTLSSGTPIEQVYAEHSNRLKSLADEARKKMLSTKDIEYSPSMNKHYAPEVRTLQAKLNQALRNAPLERRAQVIANARFNIRKEANPEMDKAEIKKLKSKELQDARERVGAKKDLVVIEPREWEAIQAGAVTKTMLNKILDNADVEKIKELATPREKPKMNTADLTRARLMLVGEKHTLAEVASALGVSVSTLKTALAED